MYKEIKKDIQEGLKYFKLKEKYTFTQLNDAYKIAGANFNLAYPTGTTTPKWMITLKRYRNYMLSQIERKREEVEAKIKDELTK